MQAGKLAHILDFLWKLQIEEQKCPPFLSVYQFTKNQAARCIDLFTPTSARPIGEEARGQIEWSNKWRIQVITTNGKVSISDCE